MIKFSKLSHRLNELNELNALMVENTININAVYFSKILGVPPAPLHYAVVALSVSSPHCVPGFPLQSLTQL